MINGRVWLSAMGLTGAVVLVAQLMAGGDRGYDRVPVESAAAGGCTPATGPDVIVGDLSGIAKWGVVGDIAAYSIGTTSCNVGSMNLQWFAATTNHPVIGQNFYRYRDGRFEQIGMSWLKHGFSAGTGSLCCTCQNPSNSQLLGIGCSDPYGAPLNGDQEGILGACGGVCGGLGPRYEVNATTGQFTFPYDTQGIAGDAIYKRLQVHLDDLDPALNIGAKYYGEGHYVTPDDAASANHHNNASYEQFLVTVLQGDSWILVLTGETVRELPAIYAWQGEDPDVVIEVVEDDGDPLDDLDGRFHLGYRVTANGDSTWHYEYALHNMNSHRSAKAFIVPVPAGVTLTNIGFHDVDYHSGDGVGGVTNDGTDWALDTTLGQVRWLTDGVGANPNANALRWGTLYNFRFDADRPPVAVNATIALFRDGTPGDVTVPTLGPSGAAPCPWDCGNGDGIVGINDFLALLGEWGSIGSPCDLDLGAAGTGIDEFLALLANWGPCPLQAACGSQDAGSCFEANGTPGCSQLECCETVCVTDPECCTVAWDIACKDLANTLCGTCGEPAAGDCCFANGTPGCDDAACCRIVCEFDPVCCASGWDAFCVSEADSICGCP